MLFENVNKTGKHLDLLTKKKREQRKPSNIRTKGTVTSAALLNINEGILLTTPCSQI
jgi:hypothetical protein